MKHDIIYHNNRHHASLWAGKNYLPFDGKLLTLLLLTACGGGGGGSGRPLAVSLDPVIVSAPDHEVEGTRQNDFIYIQRHKDKTDIKVTAGDGDDVVQGNISDDTINGEGGNDFLIGNYGDDVIRGGAGHDVIWARDGDDTASGGTGNDVIYGSLGNNTLHGDEGNDVLHAGSGTNILYGGSGDDILVYQRRNSEVMLTGGEGEDLFVVRVNSDQSSSRIIIKDFNFDEDLLNVSDVLIYSHIADGNTYFKFDGDDSNTPILIFEGLEHDFSQGGIQAEPEEVPDDDGFLRPDEPEKNNILSGTGNDDEIELGAGNDGTYGFEGNDVIYAGSGNDLIYGDYGHDKLYGQEGNDSLIGGDGNDELYGQEGNDYLSGGKGNDTLEGGDGNDRLYGINGDDILRGGAGNDYLDGGAALDIMTGGTGVDIFAFDYNDLSTRADIITDFEVGIDRLEFVAGFEVDEQYFDIVQSDGNTDIVYTKNGQRQAIVTLEGVTDEVSFEDFLFYYAEVA